MTGTSPLSTLVNCILPSYDIKNDGMTKKVLKAIERIEVFATNHPFMFQQILESYDELFWLVNAIIDSFR
jgi:hypothetical protein